VAAGGSADAVARRVEIIEGRWLLFGLSADADELRLTRAGAEPLRVALRRTAEGAGLEGEIALAELAAAGPGVWLAALLAPPDLDAVAIVAGPSGPLRARPRRGDGGALVIVLEALAPHAEARRVRVEDGALLIEGELVGAAEPRLIEGELVGAAEPRLVARLRGGGAEAAAPAELRAGRFSARLELARLARAGVWDLRLGDRRVGAHLDDLPGKKDLVVFPAHRSGGLELRP
jgi:hypothetical protein